MAVDAVHASLVVYVRRGHVDVADVEHAVLQGVAEIFKNAVRTADFAARYGGEEFLLVMPETGLEETSTLTERIRQQVSEAEFDIGDRKVKLTISIGAVLFQKGEDLEQLVSRADRALYRAKESGRNSVVAG